MKNIFCLLTLVIVFNITIKAQAGTDTIQVSTGWNLIGGLNTGYIPNIITTVPLGIITGSIYGYNPGSGYQATDTLQRGDGYWVNVSQNGKIIIETTTTNEDPCQGLLTVFYEGKTYNTLQIGTQCWLRENLDLGTRINGNQDASSNGIVEKYCYDDNPINCHIYGGLYQWAEAMNYISTPGAQGICPSGWHIPTLSEFETLKVTVNNDGNSLKAVGQGTDGGAGTNTSGFSALLAGFRNPAGGFESFDGTAYFWSSSENGKAYDMHLHYLHNGIYVGTGYTNIWTYGFSIRCIKD